MFKRSLIAASLSVAALVSAQAMAVTGGGASLPAELYKGSADSILPANFSYAVTGSGTGKNAFLTNNSSLFGTTGTVHYAGSDSVLSGSELTTYNSNYNGTYGPLIQIPSVATSVTVPYRKDGNTTLNLTSAQLCDAFSGAKTTWGQLLGTTDSTPIRIVYRTGSSGTTELFTRHLNSICPTRFATNSTFTNARLPAGGTLPSNWVGVAATSTVVSTVKATNGSLGYVSPDAVNINSNAEVSRVNGNLPTQANVSTAWAAWLRRPTPPTVRTPASGFRCSPIRAPATPSSVTPTSSSASATRTPAFPPTSAPSSTSTTVALPPTPQLPPMASSR